MTTIDASLTPADSSTFEGLAGSEGGNPYPRFAELRSEGPVAQINAAEMLGPDRAQKMREAIGGELPNLAAAVSYEAVAEVLRDAKRFSSSSYALTMGPVMGHTVLEMDPPEHTGFRGLFQQGFTRRALERWEHGLVRPIIDGAIDRFVERGHADLVRELTLPFPVSVIAGMIGVAQEDLEAFHRFAVDIIKAPSDPEVGHAASRELETLFTELIQDRRRKPREDLVSALVAAELDGKRLEAPEIIAFLRLLAPAGAETTYRSSSNLVLALLKDRRQLELLQSDPALVPRAIDEGLRWECPLTAIARTSTVDTEVCGTPIASGSPIAILLGSANHDETRWEEPERFEIRRPVKPHAAFAMGPHRCLGIHLAYMETSVLLDRLFTRLPGLRLDPGAEDAEVSGWVFRSPASLPVVWDTERSR